MRSAACLGRLTRIRRRQCLQRDHIRATRDGTTVVRRGFASLRPTALQSAANRLPMDHTVATVGCMVSPGVRLVVQGPAPDHTLMVAFHLVEIHTRVARTIGARRYDQMTNRCVYADDTGQLPPVVGRLSLQTV